MHNARTSCYRSVTSKIGIELIAGHCRLFSFVVSDIIRFLSAVPQSRIELEAAIDRSIYIMEIISKDVVRKIVAAHKGGEYAQVINQLKPGEALRISHKDFKIRYDTPLTQYFLGKFNRNGKTISCLKYGDYYYIIKL